MELVSIALRGILFPKIAPFVIKSMELVSIALRGFSFPKNSTFLWILCRCSQFVWFLGVGSTGPRVHELGPRGEATDSEAGSALTCRKKQYGGPFS